MKQRNVRLDRGKEDDRIIIPEGIVDHLPIRPMYEQVGTDEAAQRHERNTLFRRLEGGMQGRAGRVLHPDAARPHCSGKARRRAELAQAHRGRLDCVDRTCSDQQVGLQARCGQRHEVQALDGAADERARRRHGDARLLARHRQHAAVGDGRQRFIEAAGDHCSERDDFSRVAIPVYLLAIFPAYVLSQNLAQDSDCFTLSGENGTRRMRTPVASKMAFAMAAATGRIDGSPAPLGAISG
jgi:hypothetical protein